MKTLLVFLALAAIAYGQRPRPICTQTPPGWMGYYREMNYDAQPEDISYRFAEVLYDQTGKRMKIYEYEEREGERPERILKLYFYEEQKEYRVEGDQCTTRTISSQMVPFGVPPGSSFFGSDYLGAAIPGLGVYIDNFAMEMENGARFFGQYAPIGSTAYECIPITQAYIKLEGPYSQRMNVHYEFLNMTLISFFPPGAFDMPTSCITPPPPPSN